MDHGKVLPQKPMRIAAAALMAVLAACNGSSGTAVASTPSLLWDGASRIGVRCLVQSQVLTDTQAFETALCARVQALAASASALPVALTPPGDPGFVNPKAVTLLVHASVERSTASNILVFTIRPIRSTLNPTEVPFGSAPRAVALGGTGLAGRNVDDALRFALADIFPEGRDQVRPLSQD